MQAAEILMTRRQGTRPTDVRTQVLQARLNVLKKLRITKDYRDHGKTMVRLCDDIVAAQIEELTKTQSTKAEALCHLGWSHCDTGTDSPPSPIAQGYFIDSLLTMSQIERHRPYQWLDWEKSGPNNRISMVRALIKTTHSNRFDIVLPILEAEVVRVNNYRSGFSGFQLAQLEYERCICYYELKIIQKQGAVWMEPLNRALNILLGAEKPLPVNMSLLQAKLLLLKAKFYLQHIAIEGDENLFGKKTHPKEALGNLQEALQILQSIKQLSSADPFAEVIDNIAECEKLIASIEDGNRPFIVRDGDEQEPTWNPKGGKS